MEKYLSLNIGEGIAEVEGCKDRSNISGIIPRLSTSPDPAPKHSMKADKGQFDEVLRRMLKEEPKKTSEIKTEKKKPKPSQK